MVGFSISFNPRTPQPFHPMSKPDIRWLQRFQNFRMALSRLSAAVKLAAERPLSELEQQGLIHGFEYTHELGWNVLKDYLEAQGFVNIIGSKGATREAFKNAVITDGEAWMDMIKARNATSHTYKPAVADDIAKDILGRFHPALVALEKRMAEQAKQETDGL
jgi:nucleotidyltransferase substrate binding protein (TIGR01987 family)